MKKETLIRHLHSFGKTYITVFLALFLAGMTEGKSMYDLEFLRNIAEFSFISVIRNVYKLLME